MKIKKSICKRIISIMLAMVLCLTAMPLYGQDAYSAEDPVAPETTPEVTVPETEAEFNIDTVLNNAELHPQRTGYAALDQMLEDLVAPLAGKTTAEKVKALYNWTVYNIDYSWAGYGEHVYDGFKVPYPLNDYEKGLQKVIPQEIIDRTYYTMHNNKGVCYDWAAVFCVMMRYIGLDAYVHTGMFRFENNTQIGHHGWTEVQIDGVNYIFDPQREYRMTDDGVKPVDYSRYFGLRYEDTDRYNQETAINAARDAGFVSVTAPRAKTYTIKAFSSPLGSVSGAGNYEGESYANLIAVPDPEVPVPFSGWYDQFGNLVSTETSFTFEVSEDATYYAMFGDDKFYDIKSTAWYYKDATRAANLGLVGGQGLFYFNGQGKMTRAMVVQILANMEGGIGDMGIPNPFTDVKDDVWYTNAVLWAAESGIVNGMGNGKFCPNENVNRQQFMTMIVNYLNFKTDESIEEGNFSKLKFKDKNTVAKWARESVATAVDLGLVGGYDDNTLRPKQELTRAEGVKIIVKAYDFLNDFIV